MKYINLFISRINIYLIEKPEDNNLFKIEVYLIKELNSKNPPISRINIYLVEELDSDTKDISQIN